MKFYVHYQERIVNDMIQMSYQNKFIVTNVLMTFDEFTKMYDEFQQEDLLNRIGEWDDNGYADMHGKEHPLENRVAYIVCEGNAEDYSKQCGCKLPVETVT